MPLLKPVLPPGHPHTLRAQMSPPSGTSLAVCRLKHGRRSPSVLPRCSQHVSAHLGLSLQLAPPALPCGGLPTAQPCQASQLSPSSQPHLGMRSATGPEKLLVSSPCTAHGKRCPATRGADRARAGVGACCSGGATVDSLAPEGCVACEPAVSGVSPQRV